MKVKEFSKLFNTHSITKYVKYKAFPSGYTVAVTVTGGNVEVNSFRLKSNGDAYIYVTPNESKILSNVTASNVTLVTPHVNNIVHIKQPIANATVTITCTDII